MTGDTGENVCVIYSRVSTSMQVNTGDGKDHHSLDVQLAKGEGYAKYKNYKIIGRFEDAGISGTKNLDKRDGLRNAFQTLIDYETEGEKVLIFYAISRLSRSMSNFLEYVKYSEENNITLYSCQENMDMKSATGRMLASLLALFAQYERDGISERTSNTMQNLIEFRKKWCGRVAYGYKISEKGLLQETDELKTVRYIMDCLDNGMTARNILDGVFEEKDLVKTKNNRDLNLRDIYEIRRQYDNYSVNGKFSQFTSKE